MYLAACMDMDAGGSIDGNDIVSKYLSLPMGYPNNLRMDEYVRVYACVLKKIHKISMIIVL